MRAFVAINLPRGVRDEVDAICERLRPLAPTAKWVPGENLHLTLKFLDEIADDQVQPITGALIIVCRDVRSFDLQLQGFGAFPDESKARVFWLGINQSASTLKQLARQIDHSLKPLGFAPEQRAFSPHITLARFREPAPANRLMQEANRIAYQSEIIRVDRVDLMKSVLSAKGAQYSVTSSVSLA